MTQQVYLSVPQDDSNLDVLLTESNDLVVLNIQPAAVAVSSAVQSVNTLTGVVTLTTTEITEATNLYYTNARVQAVIDTNSADFTTQTYVDTGDTNTLSSANSYTDTQLVPYALTTYVDTGLTNYLSSANSYTDIQIAAIPAHVDAVTSVNGAVGVVVLATNDLTNNSGFITASTVDTLTNKSGAISQWTNDSGYLTAETDSQTLSFASPNLTISNGNAVDISALTTGLITASSTDTLTNKSGAISQWTNDANYSTTTGTVTPSSTDTFTNKSGSNSQWVNTEAYIKANTTDTLTNKSGAISQWTNDANYSTTTGTVTPTSSDTFTNKSGAISQWTNDAGYLTAETDSQTLSFASPNLTISNGNSVDIGNITATIDGGTY